MYRRVQDRHLRGEKRQRMRQKNKLKGQNTEGFGLEGVGGGGAEALTGRGPSCRGAWETQASVELTLGTQEQAVPPELLN